MRLDKIATILMLTLGIAAGAYYFSNQAAEEVEDQDAGVVFLSGLKGKINQISQIIVTNKNISTHLLRKENVWVVQEMSGYDAEFSKVKTLLLTLAEMKTIEAKTSKPENYGRLGVQGFDEPGEVDSTQIQLLDKAGNLQYTLIIGKEKSSRAPGAKSATYVRQKGDLKSWLVSGKITIPNEQVDWLNRGVIDLIPSRIQQVEINQPGENALRINKKASIDENFSVGNLPSNAELKSSSEVNSIANVLENLVFESVIVRGKFQVGDRPITTALFETFDGLKVAAKLLEKNGKHFIWFDVKANSDAEAALKESKILNAKFALWVYEIKSFKADILKTTLRSLIKLNQIEE